MTQTEQVEGQQDIQTGQAEQAVEVRQPEFAEVQEVGSAKKGENLDMLLDINMPVTVNLGGAIIPLKRLLQLGPGSVLQLDKTIGMPVELYVQDIRFATGDVVVAGEFFAVRIREIIGVEGAQEAVEK